MVDTPPIPIPEMAARLAAGDAEALLPDGVPGPVRLDGQWWAVTTGGNHYQPVTDPDALTMFETGLARLATQREHRADLITRTCQRRL